MTRPERHRHLPWILGGLAVLVLLAAVLFATTRCQMPEGCEVRLTSPADGAAVGHRETVTGTVTPPEQQVYVLVHPLEAHQWWVQPLPTADREGAWKTRAFFGTKAKGVGEDFEVLALATCRRLEQGQVLDVGDLPSDAVRSEIVTVTRDH